MPNNLASYHNIILNIIDGYYFATFENKCKYKFSMIDVLLEPKRMYNYFYFDHYNAVPVMTQDNNAVC